MFTIRNQHARPELQPSVGSEGASLAKRFRKSEGFTMIETLVVLGVITVITVVALATLLGRRSRVELDNTTKQIAALLREAQSRSVSQEGGTVWGVHFENSTGTAPFYALFKGTYSATSVVGYYRLPTSVQYSSSSIPQGGSLNITFSQISGIPSTSTTLGINQVAGGGGAGGGGASVGRTTSGKIFFDDFNRSSL